MANTVRPGDQAVHRLLDLALGLGVDRAGRLVEDQDARIVQQGARDGDPLALAARQRVAALADHGVVAVRQPADEVVGVGRARRRRPPAPMRGVRQAVADVVGDGAVEQVRVLQHHPDLAPVAAGVELSRRSTPSMRTAPATGS